jgi:hypothetical protein
MKFLKDSALIYAVLFFGGGGTLIVPYLIAITILYLIGVIG